MRTRLRRFLRSKGIKKNKKTFDLIGCTQLELRTHLEKQFGPGENPAAIPKSISGTSCDNI